MAAPQNSQPAKKGGSFGGLFGNTNKNEGESEEIKHISHNMNSLSRRLRELEERTQNMRRKVQMTDSSLMNQNKKFREEFQVVHNDVKELRNKLSDLDNRMLLLVKELRMCARQEDVKVLENYVNTWEPIQFVTRNEVEKIVKDIVEDVSEDLFKRKAEKYIDEIGKQHIAQQVEEELYKKMEANSNGPSSQQ